MLDPLMAREVCNRFALLSVINRILHYAWSNNKPGFPRLVIGS